MPEVQGEQSQQVQDNNVGSANAPGAGELVPFLERPEWVPEQFYKDGHVNFKEMAGSYGELRKKMDGTPKQGEQNSQTPPQGEQKPKVGEQNSQESNPLQAETTTIPGVGHDAIQRYNAELQKDGKLSEGSYAELAKLGYGKRIVDAYTKGMTTNPDAVAKEAVARQQFIDKTISDIGGNEVLTDMIGWASQNLSESDLKVYNDAVSSNDPARVRQAVNGLYKVYSDEVGVEPKSVGGHRPMNQDGAEPFRSNEEVVAAMQNPKYERDQAYRAEVERRLMVSNVFTGSVDVQQMKSPDKRVHRYQS